MGKLQDRIRAERSRQFVGRIEEKTLFRSTIDRIPIPFLVLSIYGPGGVGKTTLLRQFEMICQESSIPFLTLDGRNLQPTPDFFIGALCMSMGVTSLQAATQSMAEGGRFVLFIDTCEAIEPIDGWLRESLIPELSDNVLVVLLGRKRPSAAWRSDVWQSLCRSIPLRNLSAADSRSYLVSQTVPSNTHDQILSMTQGYPLALSLVAENFAQTGSVAVGPDPTLDIVTVLLDRFLESVEEPIHRDLLEVCALVRITSEALIAEVLDADRATELFAWLKSLSFMEITPLGLMPHDLARDAISMDLRWRNPDRYSALHHKVRNYYSDRMERATGPAQQMILFDYIYLHRDNPVMEPFFQWHTHPNAFSDQAHPSDLPEILRMVEKHEGSESAKFAKFWFEKQPQAFQVMRDSFDPGRLKGLLVTLNIAECPEAQEDPATAIAIKYLESTAALRKGERATYFRFWMADEGYQSVTPIQSTIFVSMVQHFLTDPTLAYSFVPCSTPEFWAPMFNYAMLPLLEAVSFEANGSRFGVFSNDWRIMPPKPWLALLSEQEVPIKEATEKSRPKGDMVVLSKEGFEDAVVEALKSFTNASKLAQNPLLKSRLVIDRLSGDSDTKEKVSTLKKILREAADVLASNSKDEKLFAALDTCYLQPMKSQEAAAEKVDVSIATFRRHLKAGTARISEQLWQQETGQ